MMTRPETLSDLRALADAVRDAYKATLTRCECCGQVRAPTPETRRLRQAWANVKHLISRAKAGRCIADRMVHRGPERPPNMRGDRLTWCDWPVVPGTLYCYHCTRSDVITDPP